jgi:RNA polymerase sigma-70 factor (ECF subfamily)
MEDRNIITLLQQRDPNAIDALQAKYGAYCTQIARNILETEQDIEECVNDSYLQVWNSIPPQEPENLAAFLAKITRNLAFNRYRNEHAQKRGSGNVTLVLSELSQIVSGGTTPEQEFDRLELSTALNAFLSTLPQWKRYILVRRCWYSESITQIARDCGRSESYVSMTLTRLRRKLRRYLIERGFDV